MQPLHGTVGALLVVMAGAFAMGPATPARLVAAPPSSIPQAADPGPTFRVFLTNGQTLASYGESAVLDDHVVFTLMIGDGSSFTTYQLISLPLAAVDVRRTAQYAYAVRAARYAATRGETDYTAMTAEVSRALEELATIDDPKARLAMAEEARRRLLGWSRENYGYRARDVEELARLFEEVIAEMRVAAGQSQFTLDLVNDSRAPVPESLRPLPTFREAIEQALGAADAADVLTDRMAILRAAEQGLRFLPETDAIREDVRRRVAAEQDLDRKYAVLALSVVARADAAAERGRVAELDQIRQSLLDDDRALGRARVGEVQSLLSAIDARVALARARAAVLTKYAARRPVFIEYEADVRTVLKVLDGSTPSLQAIRDASGPGIYWLERIEANLKRARAALAALTPPEELSDIHSTFSSALVMALEACRRRRLAMATGDQIVSGEASAAAAGAMMLTDHARKDLLARLHAPKVP